MTDQNREGTGMCSLCQGPLIHDGHTVGVLRTLSDGTDVHWSCSLIEMRVREQVAHEIEDHPGPDPSPAIPAWWSGYQEAQQDAAKIARDAL